MINKVIDFMYNNFVSFDTKIQSTKSHMDTLPTDLVNIIDDYKNHMEYYDEHKKRFSKCLDDIKNIHSLYDGLFLILKDKIIRYDLLDDDDIDGDKYLTTTLKTHYKGKLNINGIVNERTFYKNTGEYLLRNEFDGFYLFEDMIYDIKNGDLDLKINKDFLKIVSMLY